MQIQNQVAASSDLFLGKKSIVLMKLGHRIKIIQSIFVESMRRNSQYKIGSTANPKPAHHNRNLDVFASSELTVYIVTYNEARVDRVVKNTAKPYHTDL
jgi:hypothetical protein